ncbi:uncharacterized protein F54H12.2-like [Saccoglossus kowalevskii]
MAFVHEHSCECAKTELDLFTILRHGQVLKKEVIKKVNPLTNIADGLIEFVIPSARSDYINIGSMLLHIEAKITNANGSNLAADATVGPSHFWLHSLFNQIEVYLNRKHISDASPTYYYRAMIETLSNYGGDGKSMQIGAAIFEKDTAGKMNVANPKADDGDANMGLNCRYTFTSLSKTVDMIGQIHGDILFQPKYLLNGVEVRLKLHRTKNQFCLISSTENPAFKVVITNATLLMRKVKLSPSIQLVHVEALKHGTAKYPIHRCIMKIASIPADTCH